MKASRRHGLAAARRRHHDVYAISLTESMRDSNLFGSVFSNPSFWTWPDDGTEEAILASASSTQQNQPAHLSTRLSVVGAAGAHLEQVDLALLG
jgi:hypothetical protein